MNNIGDLLHQQFPDKPNREKKSLSRFDMVVRWPENAGRKINPFTHKGDHYEKDPEKQLWSLLRYWIKSHHEWLFCQIRDNSIPKNDPAHIVFWWNKRDFKIIANNLKNYPEMLNDKPIPEILK